MRVPSRIPLITCAAATLAFTACGETVTATPRASAPPVAHDAPIVFQSLAAGGGDTLYTMRQDGSDVRQLPLHVPGNAVSPDWSPDGKRIAFAVSAGDASSIWTARADGRDARELFHCGDGCLGTDYPAWSPGGRSIAFTYAAAPASAAGPPSSTAIRVIDLRSRHVRTVVRSDFPRLVDLARWSPDGRRLVVERDRFAPDGNETGCRIEIARVRDGRSRAVTSYDRFGFHPDWSPRGDLITFDTYDLLAFGDDAPGPSNLFTIRPDGNDPRQLTHFHAGGDRVSAATFTPNGARILFTYQTGGHRSVGSVASTGGALRTIPTKYGGPVTHPRLSPRPVVGSAPHVTIP
jgi:Tol biopolymer transport system component